MTPKSTKIEGMSKQTVELLEAFGALPPLDQRLLVNEIERRFSREEVSRETSLSSALSPFKAEGPSESEPDRS